MASDDSSTALALPTRADRTAKLDHRVVQKIVSHGTKTSALKTLVALSEAGLLKDLPFDRTSNRSLKRQLGEASTAHAKKNTPYGPLVQSIDLGATGCQRWDYVNPFAYIYHLSEISNDFAMMMRSVCKEGTPLRLVIYADGVVPGNPFRPEASRTLMCIYWCIADWPQHVLQRSFAWPVFSILRTKVIASLEGGLGRIMRIVLNIFFSSVGHSFARGVHINCPQGGYVVTAIFAGFLADLLGHKEITDWKGSNGVRCCFTCGNVINCLHRAPRMFSDEVYCNCSDVTRFTKRTNAEIFAIADDLARDSAVLSVEDFKAQQTEVGINHTPGGLLLDRNLRHVYRPADHMLRDWQHIVAQDGIANTHIFDVIDILKRFCGINIEQVQEFSQVCQYPSSYGKLDKSAFGRQRLRQTTIASFSSVILMMVPVLFLFLEKFVADSIPEHFEAFKILHLIIGILRMGPQDAMQHVETLRTLFANHLDAVVELYGDYVKPKAHHAFHIVDGMEWLGVLLSCFVTERKHRAIKRAALHVFRHLEHTVLHDVVNQSVQQILDGHDLYAANFLINPSSVTLQATTFRRAPRGVCRIGEVGRGDLVINDAGDVGSIVCLWQVVATDLMFAEVDLYPCIGDDIRVRATTRSKRDYFKSDTLVDVLVWYVDSPGIIRTFVPPKLLFAR